MSNAYDRDIYHHQRIQWRRNYRREWFNATHDKTFLYQIILNEMLMLLLHPFNQNKTSALLKKY